MSPAGNEPELIDHVYGVVPPVAERVAPYAAFTCPPISEVFVNWSGGIALATFRLKDFVADCGVGAAS